MAKNTQPVLKRCRTLGVSPAAMGYAKSSKKNPGGQRRAKKSEYAMQLTEKTGDLAALMFVHEDEDILLITDDGTIIRTRAADVRLCGRSTQGVRIMRLAEGSSVVGVCRAEKEEEEPEETETLEEGTVTGEAPQAETAAEEPVKPEE